MTIESEVAGHPESDKQAPTIAKPRRPRVKARKRILGENDPEFFLGLAPKRLDPLERILPVDADDAEICRPWADKISDTWNRSFETIIKTGDLLAEAKHALGHGRWLFMCRSGALPFGEDKAGRLMKIARHPRLRDSAIWRYLPLSYRALAELSKLSVEQFDECLRLGYINPEMTVFDAATVLKKLLADIEEVSGTEHRQLIIARDAHAYATKRLPLKWRIAELAEFARTIALPAAESNLEPDDVG